MSTAVLERPVVPATAEDVAELRRRVAVLEEGIRSLRMSADDEADQARARYKALWDAMSPDEQAEVNAVFDEVARELRSVSVDGL